MTASKASSLVDLSNPNRPGFIRRVDAGKYEAVRTAILAVLQREAAGLPFSELVAGVRTHLPERLFPGGTTCGWWTKNVQLDLEAKGILVRAATKPARWRSVAG